MPGGFRRCLYATLCLLERELLRKDPEKHDYSVYQMLEGNRVAVNGANAIVVGLSRGTNLHAARSYSRTEME
jgi:hypothetical protein